LALGRNAFHLLTRDGKRVEFTVYGAVPIDVVPLYEETRDGWISAIDAARSEGSVVAPSCETDEGMRRPDGMNPQVLVVLLWCVIAVPVLAVLALVDTPFGLLSAAFGVCLLGLILGLTRIRSG
jgi:hypothetical protein